MKLRRRTSGVLAAVGALAAIIILIVPIVPYSLSLQVRGVYEPGVQSCIGPNLTPQDLQSCLDKYQYPPTNITGRASLPYALSGVGIQPFNGSYKVTAGNYSAIFYLTGTKVTYAQLFPFLSFELNPQGVVAITNTTVALNGLGLVNLTATIENIGTRALPFVYVNIQVPNQGFNQTYAGITWSNYYHGSRCALDLAPGSSCSVSYQPLSDSLSGGQPFSYGVEVVTSTNASQISTDPILYQKFFQGVWPAKGIAPDWVSALIQQVNSNRTGPKLVEDQTLDAFAATRFDTQVANFNISNYGFQGDYSASFPGSTRQIGEVTLWPGLNFPSGYAGFLQQYAPGHWSVLTNPNFKQFGYYIGYGPSIVVSQPCSITEFPGNVNMPALLASNGCQFHIEQAVWLVIEVGS